MDAVEGPSSHTPRAAFSSPRRSLADLFDDEGLWNAEDTDDCILEIAGELETTLSTPVTEVADSGGNSLLHMVAIWNRPKVMEALIRRGIELNNKNGVGQTPLDLATHYGNVDLALQLRHYGAKHTCESERDLAIAQRDLAQRQLRDLESDFADVQRHLKTAKQEREELRVERDRLAEDKQSVLAERDALVIERESLAQLVESLKRDCQKVLLDLAQLREAFVCESNARLAAVQGWQSAQQAVTELQEREVRVREREREIMQLRGEAKSDRDVARERARLAELDQGKARQAQLEAERERDVAVQKQLEAENAIASERHLWAKRIAKTERDRKYIQIEIDRQTKTLRKECDRLEKSLHTENSVSWKLREELVAKNALVERLDGRLSAISELLKCAESMNEQLERKVANLEQVQQSEHKAWRDRLERKLRDAAHQGLRRIVSDVASTAESVIAQVNELREVSESSRCGFQMRPELTLSLFSDSVLDASLSSPLKKKPTGLLPLLPDRTCGSAGSDASQPQLSLAAHQTDSRETGPDVLRPTVSSESRGGSVEPHTDLSFLCDTNVAASVVATARAALNIQLDELLCSTVADLVGDLSEALRQHIINVSSYINRNWRYFRKQIEVLEKMVERKDELITRFNQHRREKPKKQPARMRDCLYKPVI